MHIKRILLTILLTLSFLNLPSCSKQVSSSDVKSTSIVESKNTLITASVIDTKVKEAKEIATNYFLSLNNSNVSNSNKYWKTSIQTDPELASKVFVTELKLLSITESNKSKSYDSNPYDAISFDVEYNITYSDESLKYVTESNGLKKKTIWLTKDSESSEWKIDDLGY